MNTEDGALDFEVLLNNDKFKDAVDESVRRIKGLSKATAAEGTSVDGIFQKLGSTVGNLIGPVSALTVAYKFKQLAQEALEFENAFGMAMREVQTISVAVQEDMKGISEAIVDMAANGPDDAVKLAKAYYQIVSAGHDGAKGLELLSVASKAATAGVTDTLTAADGLTTVINAWGLGAEKANDVADVMFKTVERGKTTFSQLASSIAQVAPLASANGIGLNEIFAALQTITKQGTPTAQAMTQIRSSIVNMNNTLGDGWSKTMSYQEGLNLIAKRAGGSATELKKLIPDVEGMSAVLAMTGEKAKGAAEDLEETAKAAGSMETAYGRMMTEADNRWSVIHNKWTREMRALGKSMKEGSSMFADFLDDLLTREIPDIIDPGAKKIVDETAASIANLATKEEKLTAIIAKINELKGKRIDTLNPVTLALEKQDNPWLLRQFEKIAPAGGIASQLNHNAVVELNRELEITKKAEKELFKLYTEILNTKNGAKDKPEKALRALADVNKEIAAAKELQETSTNKTEFKNIQKTIDKLEAEKLAITGVKTTVDELKKAQEALEAAVVAGDKTAIKAATKKVDLLEKQKKQVESLIELEKIRAWRAQFDSQPMSSITPIGVNPIQQIGSQKMVKGVAFEITAFDKTGPVWKKMKLEGESWKKWRDKGRKEGAELDKKTDEESTERKIQAWQDVLAGAQRVTSELAKQGVLSEAEAVAISDTLGAIASGNPIQMAAEAISMIISMFPQSAAAKYAEQIERINQALRDQQRLIDQAGREGGEKEARQKEIEILRQKKAANEAALAEAQRKLDNKIFDVGPVYWERVHKVRELTQAVEDDRAAIEDAEQALEDFLAGGITQNTIADAIAQGFLDGKTSVDDFADYLNDILLGAVTDIFKNQYLLPDINSYLTPLINKALDDNEVTEAEKKGIDEMTKWIADRNSVKWDALTGALDFGEDAAAAQSGAKGISASASEETMVAMVGQAMAMRVDMKEMSVSLISLQDIGLQQVEILDASLYQLTRIGKNTDNLSRLEGIGLQLDTINETLKRNG